MIAKTPRFDRKSKREFSQTLRQRVNQYFDENNLKRTADSRFLWKAVFMFTLYFAPFVLILTLDLTGWQYLLCSSIMGVGTAGIGLGIMHDSNHGSVSTSSWVNRLLGYSLNIIGGHALCWRIQHNVLHHSFTNVHGVDEDLEAGKIMRFTPNEPWKARHRGQHLYAWLLYSLMTFSWVLVKDFKSVNKYNRLGLLEGQGVKYWPTIFAITISKILYVSYIIVLPIALGYAWWVVLGSFVIMHMIGGMMLAMIFQPAHVMEDHTFIENDREVIMESYESHQLNTTSNFAPTNKLLTWFCGGLNYQVEHHIFPNVSHVHYPAISKIVKQTAQEFSLPYRSVPSFRQALMIHQRTLKKLGQPGWA